MIEFWKYKQDSVQDMAQMGKKIVHVCIKLTQLAILWQRHTCIFEMIDLGPELLMIRLRQCNEL